MSGFAGIVRLEPTLETAESDRLAIARMAEAIAFRGPDARTQVVQDGAAFAFSLLTIGPAPQAPAQPITLDGETFFLGEARIDGREELTREFRQHGADILSMECDEALVLRFVEHFGAEALPKLDGDFSFVLWMPGKRKLFAFRDLTGARPFFYAAVGGLLVFSNMLQAVIAGASVSRSEFDFQFLGNFLLGSPQLDGERTIYRDIRRLPAGHLLEFSGQHCSARRVANFPIEEPQSDSDPQVVVEEFRGLLQAAVSDRLPDKDVAMLLSGGLDSTSIASTIVALRRQGSPRKGAGFHALCVDFQPLFRDDESEYASSFAEAFGIELNVIHSGNVLPFAGWEESSGQMPEPLMDPYSLLYLSYRQEVSRKARVVFSGDGGDEVLRLQAAPYLRFLWRSRGAVASARVLLRWILQNHGLPPLGFGLRSGFLRTIGRDPAEEAFPPWFMPEFEREHDLRRRWVRMTTAAPVSHQANPQAYRILNSGRFAEVQELCDPLFTGVALETRNPFLDRRLCRFLLRLPLIPWTVNKHLLRVAQAGVLPEKIRLRPKTPMVQDSLVHHVRSGAWNPLPDDSPHPVLGSIVNWDRLREAIISSPPNSLYVHLRAVAVSRWLKSVEIGGLA